MDEAYGRCEVVDFLFGINDWQMAGHMASLLSTTKRKHKDKTTYVRQPMNTMTLATGEKTNVPNKIYGPFVSRNIRSYFGGTVIVCEFYNNAIDIPKTVPAVPN